MLPSELENRKVILSPLDWGMGHTTRCISIIELLLSNNNEVVFAGNPDQISLIQKDFPNLKTVELQGYNMKLDSKRSTYFQLVLQSAKMKSAIKKEYNQLEEILKTYPADVVISDNRYGFHAKDCINIILTHQLNLPVPLFKKTASKVIQSYVNKFDFCWIPDTEKSPISGNLSEGEIAIPKVYIGLLSRFEKEELPEVYKYLAIISGPEPERARFAKNIIRFLSDCSEPTAIVGIDEMDTQNVSFFKNPSTNELGELINKSGIIISRAGYTTIMELAAMKKNAVLIPTKGQYEQEYLSNTINELNFQFKSEEKFLSI